MDLDPKYQLVRQTLTVLGYPQYEENFVANRITDDILHLFKENELEKIIPEIGIRKLFFLKATKSKEDADSQNLNDHLQDDELLSQTTFSRSPTPTCTFKAPISSPVEMGSSENSFRMDDDDSSHDDVNPETQSETFQLIAVHENSIIGGLVPVYDMKTIMQEYDPVYGEEIWQKILGSNSVTPHQRKILTRAAVDHLRKTSIGAHPSPAAKQAMANYLGSVIPSMPAAAWYSKHPKANATGRLEYRIGNVEKSMRKKFGILQQPPLTKSTTETETVDSILTDKEYEDRKQWLKDNRDDKATIKKYLEETFSKRRNEVMKNGLSAREWPCFFHDYNLVHDEFSRLPEGKMSSLNIYSNWTESVSRKILKFASSQGIDYREKLSIACDYLSVEAIHIAAASIIPFIFSNGAVMVQRKRRKISNPESLSYFAELYPVGTNIETLCQIEKKRTQPFIIILGNFATSTFEQYFVMSERKAIVCNSFHHAVDTCFKLFYIMSAKFPTQCQDVWQFFESFVYSLSQTKSTHLQLRNFIIDEN